MDRWTGRVALVTGASAGIGAAIVRALVCQGMKVVGCARNVAKIESIVEELKGEKGSLKAIRCDVSKEADILSMFEVIRKDPNLGGVDVCVSNAGLAHPEPLLTGSTERWKEMLDVNVLGLCVCTREAFKSMQERKVDDGHLILISSMSGHRVINSAATHFYSATKYAVSAILEGVRNELRELRSGIRVTAVSPGLVETEFAHRMNTDDPAKADKIYSSIKCLQSEDISNTVLYILGSPPYMQVHDVLMRPTHQTT